MGREIKFRVWDGLTFYSPWLDAKGNVYRSKTDLIDEDNALNDTVQQFTGVKDKNDKEIYEGDIFVDTAENIHLVTFDEHSFYF
ncbi:hypothetical protein BSK49_16435 [Paenibacillus odorifer]|nr:hypothetical protein BSK49_16435 [Paenibacillus odorifer]